MGAKAAVKNKLPADMIISNATIYTVFPEWKTYDAMAIKGGKIIALGTDKEILDDYTSNNKINAHNNFVYPGFIDAHCHFSGFALDKYKCDLTEAKSFKEVLKMLEVYDKANKMPWVFGKSWDQNQWKTKEFPDKDSLDKLFPDKPVILERIDGHALLCNQKALDMAKITSKTNIYGGIIGKKNGELTGMMIDNAMEPIEKLIAVLPEAEAMRYLQEAEMDCYKEGVTGVVDCGVNKHTIELLKKMYAENKLEIGNSLLLADDSETLKTYAPLGPQKWGQLQIAGIKMFADGALGSRGACLIDDYSDNEDHAGMLITTVNHMRTLADLAMKNNLQLCTHAIGDSANRTVVKLYARYLKEKNDRRWRVEHAQIVQPEDLHYFGDFSIIPSVQPTHLPADMPWAIERLGKERFEKAGYPFNDLMKQNGWIALGTDFPVEPINPLATYYTAVFRTLKAEGPGYLPNNALSKFDAIKGMTIWAARSVYLEDHKGSIEIGKDADLVILDNDLVRDKRSNIMKNKVLYTIVNGKVKYKRKSENILSEIIHIK